MIRFLAKSQREQELRLSGKIPSIEEYWAFRMGTSAVGVGVAALEYGVFVFPNRANRAYGSKGLPIKCIFPARSWKTST